MRINQILGATLALSVAALPALAQSTATQSTGTHAAAANAATHATTTAPATGTVGNTARTAPSDRNPVMTDGGDARASKVIGSSVYNDHDEKVGSVDDLLIAKDGKLSAVVSVGGFLGMGTKYVLVPYSGLTFGNTQKDSDNRVVLKGATKDSLKNQAAYTYTKA